MDLNVAASLCNFGTFTSFIIVCVAILILRKIDPDRERPFKVPFCPWFPLMGVLCCGGLMVYSMVIAFQQGKAQAAAAILSTELMTNSVFFSISKLDGLKTFGFISFQVKFFCSSNAGAMRVVLLY